MIKSLSNLELIKLLKEGKTEAREILIEKNITLVRSIVNKYQVYYYDKEDLFQIGCLGLIKAIDKFDVSYSVQFSTYAVPIIIGEIKQFFRDEGNIKVGRKLKELYIKIADFKQIYFEANNNEPRIEDIAKYLNVTIQDIILALESHFYPTSLDETIYEKNDNEIKLKDTIYEKRNFEDLDYILLDDAIAKLSKFEKLIIYLRYYEGYNQCDIAKKIGVSQVQVSRLEKQIIEKLRKEFV